jgi:hypothetical protein
MCESIFHYYNKIPEIIYLKGEKVYGCLWFWRFKTMAGWPCCFWACGRQCILVGVGGSGIERERGRDWRPTVPFEGMIQ